MPETFVIIISIISTAIVASLVIYPTLRRNTRSRRDLDRIFSRRRTPLNIRRYIGEYEDDIDITGGYEDDIDITGGYEKRKEFSLDILPVRRRNRTLLYNRIERIIEDKRQKFLNIPSISFHYADDDQIKNFYNEYFKEPTIENLVSEITGEVSGEIKSSLPQILESHVGSQDISKWISTIKLPDVSLNGMFLRFQRETIKNNQVALGIEEVDIELTELKAFEDAIKDFKNRFNFEIDETNLDTKRAQLKEKAAEKTLHKLEQATGWVLIEGKFKIENNEEFYRCTYHHPVNTYLSNQFGPVTISVLIPKNSLKEHIKGNYALSVNRTIPLKIYGQVWQPLDIESNVMDLQLTPLAIY
jgi:hypothetical protein